jgi:hypothetical protein
MLRISSELSVKSGKLSKYNSIEQNTRKSVPSGFHSTIYAPTFLCFKKFYSQAINPEGSEAEHIEAYKKFCRENKGGFTFDKSSPIPKRLQRFLWRQQATTDTVSHNESVKPPDFKILDRKLKNPKVGDYFDPSNI